MYKYRILLSVILLHAVIIHSKRFILIIKTCSCMKLAYNDVVSPHRFPQFSFSDTKYPKIALNK